MYNTRGVNNKRKLLLLYNASRTTIHNTPELLQSDDEALHMNSYRDQNIHTCSGLVGLFLSEISTLINICPHQGH